MPKALSPLDLAVPRNKTALMLQLQFLVCRTGYRMWCGGVICRTKLAAFITKMAARYPITRSTRQRTYDRKRGIAVVHFMAYAVGDKVHWWLLSDAGKGGLADKSSEDARVARDAMSADGHIIFGDYVLVYATKREWREVQCPKTKKPRGFHKQTSTWTWKLRTEVMRELKHGIELCCEHLEYGSEGGNGKKAWGLRGLLATMRSRPLFSGVRSQVLELHRDARDLWKPRRPLWCERYPAHVEKYKQNAGALTPIGVVMANELPKIPRMKVYAQPPETLRGIIADVAPEVLTVVGDKNVSH
ncbi:hypothetical protein [Cupriavidus pinatubonensis]|uniref:Uncharacterized protein n=1 Tax=Cupriavidus pinatubonensis TaxID=248026 RepID=A0ABM8XGA6_9BURK|nr:hypothetical protein [Cupriavidus pinatubonensis]CAG9179194.1 hypothetical protein LMG23994_04093 [Cupriavidus pinatubonensis]